MKSFVSEIYVIEKFLCGYDLSYEKIHRYDHAG